jgi:hypothetical protein
VRKADNLPPSSADVTESGSLNLPEPSGPHRPVMGLLYLFLCIKIVCLSYGICGVGVVICGDCLLTVFFEGAV